MIDKLLSTIADQPEQRDWMKLWKQLYKNEKFIAFSTQRTRNIISKIHKYQ